MTGANGDQDNATQAQPLAGQLAIQKIYAKDISFEAPQSPHAFLQKLNPTIDVQLNNQATRLDEEVHEVVLTVTVTVRSEDKPLYVVEVQQAGIFTIAGFPPEHLGGILATACPNILFPYAREAVSDLVIRGGYPPLLLAPVNFDALYAQELKRRQQGVASHAEQAH